METNGPGHPVNIRDLGGVWRRTLLIDADGRRDDTSAVFWLQVGVLAGDIRATREAAAAQTAFVGPLSNRGPVFAWTPVMAHGSVTDGSPDEGTLSFEGDRLREDGVHAKYIEYWEQDEAPSADDHALAWRLETGLTGYLMAVGRYRFCAFQTPDGPGFILAEQVGGEAVVSLARVPIRLDRPDREEREPDQRASPFSSDLSDLHRSDRAPAVGWSARRGQRVPWPTVSGETVVFAPNWLPPDTRAVLPADCGAKRLSMGPQRATVTQRFDPLIRG